MTDEGAVIGQLSQVSKALAGRPVLSGLDLSVRAGEVTALLGPNGAGKTTAVSVLTGRLSADTGAARLFGVDPGRPAARRRLGVMLQRAGLPDVLTVGEIVALQSGYYPDPLALERTLDLTGLRALEGRRCGALSGGQARRVQYALAICGSPDFLVLDEPTAAMDRASALTLWETVRGLADTGVAVLLTSHDLREADALADRVLVMDEGRIIADDTPAAIRARVGGAVIRCRSELPLVAAAALPAALDVSRAGADLRLVTTDATATIGALLDTDRCVTGLRVADAALEDAIDALLSPRSERKAA